MNTKRPTILIVGAAEEHRFAINAAHELGLKVFATDGNPKAPGFLSADNAAVASTYDVEETLQAARAYIEQKGRLDGVMTLAADVPYTVAYVAEKLGLPGIGTQSALNASEKMRMKRCFEAKSVPTPLFDEVRSADQLQDKVQEVGLPLIVKPVDSRGGRGVQLITSSERLLSAFQVALDNSPSGRVMIEEYLLGPQLSTEGFLLDGEAFIPAIFDRNYEYLQQFAPFMIENGGEMPSIYAAQYWEEIHDVMKQAALALGIKTGVVKGDLVIHKNRIKVIEIAARMSGGFFGTVATPASCGVDMVKTNIQLSLNGEFDPSNLEHRFKKAAAIRFAFPKQGRLNQVTGLQDILRDPACWYAHVFVDAGDMIQPITHHPARPAVVVAEGQLLEEAINNAERLIDTLQWDIDGIAGPEV